MSSNVIGWKDRLRVKLSERRMTMKAASIAAGQNETFVRDVLERNRTPSIEKFADLARALGTTVAFLLDGPRDEGGGWHSVPVMGFIGAGAEINPEFEQIPPDGLATVDLPFAVPDEMIGLQVKGDSMLPRYDDGDVVVVWREQRRATDTYVGHEAAVRTEDGRRFLKRMMRGRSKSRFNLESWNAKTIEDVAVAWVGEIYVTVRATHVRTIPRPPEPTPATIHPLKPPRRRILL